MMTITTIARVDDYWLPIFDQIDNPVVLCRYDAKFLLIKPAKGFSCAVAMCFVVLTHFQCVHRCGKVSKAWHVAATSNETNSEER